MLRRRRAIMLLISRYRQHGMSSRVVGKLLQDAVQMRDSMCAVRLILELHGAFERRKIIRRDAQRLVERAKGFLVFAEICKGIALQHPQLAVLRKLLQCGGSELKGLREVSGPQRRLYGLSWAGSVLPESCNRQRQCETNS